MSASGWVLSHDSQQVASWPVLLQAQCPLPFSYFKFLTLSMTFLPSSRSWREQVSFSVCVVIQPKRDKHLLYARPAKCHLRFMPPPKVLALWTFQQKEGNPEITFVTRRVEPELKEGFVALPALTSFASRRTYKGWS